MRFHPLLILTGGCVAGLLAITPFMAQANSADIGSPTQFISPSIGQATAGQATAQANQPKASADYPLRQAFEQLDLTPEQQSQFSRLRQDTRAQIQAILQPEQRQQFLSTWQQGGGFREAVTAMNLSDGQRQQVRQVFQSARAQARDLLTESQRQELRELIQNRLNEAL